MNVALVLVTRVTGFLPYARTEGLQDLLHRKVAFLIPVTSVLLSTFQLRHLDHEVNIADYGSVLWLPVADLVQKDGLQYEIFIDSIRGRRPHQLAGVPILGNEAFQLLFRSLGAATLSVITCVVGANAYRWGSGRRVHVRNCKGVPVDRCLRMADS